MPAKNTQKWPKQVREVLEYFLRHPEAVDTLEGIARWRVRPAVIEQQVQEIHAALEWLFERKLLRKKALGGAAPIFSLTEKGRVCAQRLFAGTSCPPRSRRRRASSNE